MIGKKYFITKFSANTAKAVWAWSIKLGTPNSNVRLPSNSCCAIEEVDDEMFIIMEYRKLVKGDSLKEKNNMEEME